MYKAGVVEVDSAARQGEDNCDILAEAAIIRRFTFCFSMGNTLLLPTTWWVYAMNSRMMAFWVSTCNEVHNSTSS